MSNQYSGVLQTQVRHTLSYGLSLNVFLLSWWRKKFDLIIKHCHINLVPDQEGEQFTLIFIVHSPYFQHPVTKLFWTQDQAYEWKIVSHSFHKKLSP